MTVSYGCNSTYRLRYWNCSTAQSHSKLAVSVATVLTVYGIETHLLDRCSCWTRSCCNSTYRLRYWNYKTSDKQYFCSPLQQYLPFTVLKPLIYQRFTHAFRQLQQYLPFTVLKPARSTGWHTKLSSGCNSTYRLRYWNAFVKDLRELATSL